MSLPRDLSLAETKALLELVKQRQGFTSDIEAGQWLLERQRANLAAQHREPPRRDTQAPNYGLVNSLMDAGKKSPRSFYGPPRYTPVIVPEVTREPADLGNVMIEAIGGETEKTNHFTVSRNGKKRNYFASGYSFGRMLKIANSKVFSNKFVSVKTHETYQSKTYYIFLSDFPESVTFYDQMAVHAARRRSYAGGGWRAYVLAKALDRHGLGMVKRDDLQAYAAALGVHVRTWQRWLKQARNNDLLIDIQKGDDWYFILPGPGAAAFSMGCEVGSRKVSMRADLLIGKGWKAFVFDGAQAARGQQMTRERLQKIYNVPVRTQRYRTAQAGTRCLRHYAKSGLGADSLAMVQEYSNHKGVFLARNKLIYWRLPDSRTSKHAQDAGRGRARKANSKLRRLQELNGLTQMQQALSDVSEPGEYIRLFNHTRPQRKANEKKLARLNSLRVKEIYMIDHLADSGAGIWEHIPR